MVDVVDHLPISRSCSRSLRRHERAALPHSVTRTVVDVDVPLPVSAGSGRSRSSLESQQHDGVVVVVEKNSCRASPKPEQEKLGGRRGGKLGLRAEQLWPAKLSHYI